MKNIEPRSGKGNLCPEGEHELEILRVICPRSRSEAVTIVFRPTRILSSEITRTFVQGDRQLRLFMKDLTGMDLSTLGPIEVQALTGKYLVGRVRHVVKSGMTRVNLVQVVRPISPFSSVTD